MKYIENAIFASNFIFMAAFVIGCINKNAVLLLWTIGIVTASGIAGSVLALRAWHKTGKMPNFFTVSLTQFLVGMLLLLMAYKASRG